MTPCDFVDLVAAELAAREPRSAIDHEQSGDLDEPPFRIESEEGGR